MKKVVSLLLVAVLLFTLSFSCFAASGAVAGIAIDTVFSFVSDTISIYNNSIQKRTEAARGYYFYCILNDDISGGITVFNSSGTKFTDEILKFYFDRYLEALNGSDIYDSNGNIFIQAAGFPDTKFSLSLLSFAEYHIMQEDDGYDTTFNAFKSYYNTLLARYLLEQGETATDLNPGKSGLDIAPGYVTSEELVEGINVDNNQLVPKSHNTWKSTYRTNNFANNYRVNHSSIDTQKKRQLMGFTLSDDSAGNSSFSSLYLIPYFKDKNGNDYYSQIQFHLYLKTWDDPNSDVYLCLDAYEYSSSLSSPVECVSDFHVVDLQFDYMPVKFNFGYSVTGGLQVFTYNNLSDYVDLNGRDIYSIPDTFNYNSFNPFFYDGYYKYYTPDLAQSFKCAFDYYANDDTTDKYGRIFWNAWGSDYDDGVSDIGYIVSNDMIQFCYTDIDTSKIPKNQIVTVNGDTIYNYTISNPDTGESNTVNEYITNNYTYITNNNGGGEAGSSSGSGGVGGNVTVGGSIDVGGSVGVDITVSVPDININVNGNGSGAGGSGTIANPDDFTSADNVDLNKYYDTAVEQSTGFQKFLQDFFGFLPAELLGLILFAVAMAIVCRVFGR